MYRDHCYSGFQWHGVFLVKTYTLFTVFVISILIMNIGRLTLNMAHVIVDNFCSLQPRDAPDVVRSTYAGDFRVTGSILGVPEKINIPERYVPEEQVRPDA